MRVLATLILVLLLGALLNVAVAFACARWGDGFSLEPPKRVDVESVPEYAEECLNDPATMQTYGSSSTKLRELTNRTFACTRLDHQRYWYDGDAQFFSVTCYSTRFGLPFRSMHYTEVSAGSWLGSGVRRSDGWCGGWPLPPDRTNPATSGQIDLPAHVYPLTPLPVGFAANTLIYAVIISPLVPVVRAYFHRRAIRRGVCPRCRYPIGVSPVCSECGEPLGLARAPHSGHAAPAGNPASE